MGESMKFQKGAWDYVAVLFLRVAILVLKSASVCSSSILWVLNAGLGLLSRGLSTFLETVFFCGAIPILNGGKSQVYFFVVNFYQTLCIFFFRNPYCNFY